MTEWDSDSSTQLFSYKDDVIKKMPMGESSLAFFLFLFYKEENSV